VTFSSLYASACPSGHSDSHGLKQLEGCGGGFWTHPRSPAACQAEFIVLFETGRKKNNEFSRVNLDNKVRPFALTTY
jgi:hypothetical protein